MKLHPLVRASNLASKIATPIFVVGVICGLLKLMMPPSPYEIIFGKIALSCGGYIFLQIALMIVALKVSKPIVEQWRFSPASFLCKSMAVENDRVIRNQIEMWTRPMYWDGCEPPIFAGFQPASLAMARLMGAAAPIAVVSLMEPETVEGLCEEVLKGYTTWSTAPSKLDFSPDLARELLSKYITLIAESYSDSDSDTAIRELADNWYEAIISSWGDPKFTARLKEERDPQIIPAILNQNSHASSQLQ